MARAQTHGDADRERARRAVPLLRPGHNCWRVARARRASILVDGAAYFAALAEAFERARRSILILGWDFDGGVALDPLGRGDAALPLRAYWPGLLARRPELEVRILVWGFSVVYGQNQCPPPLLDPAWPDHPRLHFRFANDHPLGACHHQKLVCVDDALAFCGGLDLTARRWDVPSHDPLHPGRIDARGRFYPPKHDVQLAVDGEAGAALAELARGRWYEVTGEVLPAPAASETGFAASAPSARCLELADVPVGIARTRAACRGNAAIREVEALTLDALGAARECVYVESQYLTSRAVGECLLELLARPDAPELVLVLRNVTDGMIQRFAMGGNRTRLLRRLVEADRGRKLRVYYPAVRDAAEHEHEISVHSKVLAVDDRFLRIGSSNLNNRSMGFDSECDVAIAAEDEHARAGVRAVVHELLGEHLGRNPAHLARVRAECGSLIRAVERLNGGGCKLLVPFAVGRGPRNPIPGTAFADPAGPLLARWRSRSRARV